MLKEIKLVLGITTLLLFVSAHFLIGMYFNSFDKPLYFWLWSDIFLYLGIFFHIIYVVIITFER